MTIPRNTKDDKCSSEYGEWESLLQISQESEMEREIWTLKTEI